MFVRAAPLAVVLSLAAACAGTAGPSASAAPSASASAASAASPSAAGKPADAVGITNTKLAEGPLAELPAAPLYVNVIDVPQPASTPITHSHVAGFVYTLSGTHQLAIQGGDTKDVKAGEAGFVGAGVGHTHANPGPAANDWYFVGLRPSSGRVGPSPFPGSTTVYDTGDLPATALVAGKYVEQLNLVTLEKGGRTSAHKHGGLEIFVVLAGTVQVRTATGQPVSLAAGKGAYVMPNTVVQASNTGDGQAKFLAFFVTQEGQAFSTNVDSAP